MINLFYFVRRATKKKYGNDFNKYYKYHYRMLYYSQVEFLSNSYVQLCSVIFCPNRSHSVLLDHTRSLKCTRVFRIPWRRIITRCSKYDKRRQECFINGKWLHVYFKIEWLDYYLYSCKSCLSYLRAAGKNENYVLESDQRFILYILPIDSIKDW